ncbi:site-2 protease family protein [Chlamydiota bacterium]
MFRKRYDILTVAGIKIGIDISWFFIAVLIAWTLAAFYFPSLYHNLTAATYWFMGILGMLGLFVCVVLHELGHAAVAKYYKLPISQITLFLFGGIAEIKKEPTSAKSEFLMAIAGPLVSFILAGFLYLLTRGGLLWGWSVAVTGVTGYLALINLLLALFNLLPAFPLDGGRVLRAILWGWKKNLGWATDVSTRLGSAFGYALMFLGIFILFSHNFLAGFWLIILGWFLHHAATAMRSQFYVGKELGSEKVVKFMKENPISVAPTVSIREFVDHYVYQSHHHLYPVTQEGKLLGYISLKEVKTLAQDEWGKTTVQKIMIPKGQFQTASPDTSALDALNLMQESDSGALLVVSDEQLVGILTAQDLFKVISLKLELEEEQRR